MNKKTNIVLLTDCLADLAGGAEKQIFELAKGLDKERYNVTIVSLDCYGKAPRELIESAGCRLEIFRVVRIYGLSGVIQGFKFMRFLDENDIHVLMTYHFSSDIWGTFWARLADVPVVISNRRDMGFWRKGPHIKTYRLFNRWVRKIVGNAGSIKDLVMKEEGVPENKIEIIYNGVDMPKPRPADFNPGFTKSPDDILIMNVANLKPVKGHQYLLKAFAEVLQIHPNARLALVGKDEYSGSLQKQCEELGIKDKVFFLGKRQDVQQILPLADICILQSLSEGMSNAILEYMVAAKPVIATNVGGNPELVRDGINGILVEKENAQAIKDALLKLINDKPMRERMGKAGFERVQAEFSMPAMIGRYDRLFKELYSEKKTRILHLVSSGGLFGAEQVILNLASRTQNADCFVGALDNTHNPHLEIIDEAKRMGFNTVIFQSRGQFDFRTWFQIARFIRSADIDIVHTHNYKSDISSFWASRISHKKWVATNHVWHGTDSKLKFYEALDAFFLKFADQVIAVSHEIKDDLLHKGIKDARITVIDNGINVERFYKSADAGRLKRTRFGLAEDTFAVAIVGRLAKEKGHDIFLKAAQTVSARHPHVRFLIVGDGPLLTQLKQMTQDLGLPEQVKFTGIQEDMASVYAACDLLVNSSYIEGLPITILEAMAARVPIIATSVGAVPKAIENERNGILLEPGDPETLANAMNSLIENASRRERFAEAAYIDVCERFSDTRMGKEYRKIYQKVLWKEPRPSTLNLSFSEDILTPKTPKIKVLHFISSGGLFGAENVILNIAESFNNDRYVSIVAAIRDARKPNLKVIDRARALGLPVHVFESKGQFDMRTVKALRAFIINCKIDILHTHNYKSDIIGALASKGTGVSLISTAHGFTDMNSKVSFYEFMDRWFLKRYFERTIMVTNEVLPNFPVEKKRVIGNGIDFKKFIPSPDKRQKIRASYDISDSDILIGTVGRLSVEKNQALLLESLKEIIHAHTNVKVMLIGEGPEGPALKSLVARNGLEKRVIFTGLVENPAPFYQAFDIFVLCSRTEGLPLTVLEAMASRVPVVATKVGGIPGIITDNSTGLLVDSGNAPQLCQAIGSLVSDPARREALREAAFHFAKEHYSIDRMNHLYNEIYQEVLAK